MESIQGAGLLAALGLNLTTRGSGDEQLDRKRLMDAVRKLERLLNHQELDNATRGPLRLAASGHDHDADYADISHTHAAVDPYPQDETDYLRDTFMGGSTTSGSIGTHGWQSNGSITQRSAEAGHPGILRLNGGATLAAIGLMGTTTPPLDPANAFDLTWVARPGSNTAGAAGPVFRIGLANAWNVALPNNGIYIEKKAADGSWYGVTRSGAVETRTAALVAVTANQWYRFRVRRIDSSTVGFSVDGGTEATLTATIPTTQLSPVAGASSTGTLYTLDLDDVELYVRLLNRW